MAIAATVSSQKDETRSMASVRPRGSIDDSIHKILRNMHADPRLMEVVYDGQASPREKLASVQIYLSSNGIALDPDKRFLVLREFHRNLEPEYRFLKFCPFLDVLQDYRNPKLYHRTCMGTETQCSGILSGEVVQHPKSQKMVPFDSYGVCAWYWEMKDAHPEMVRSLQKSR